MKTINIYADGACKGNPGPGGIGVILTFGPHEKEISQGYVHSTNNRMELRAVMEGFKALKEDSCNVIVTTDSKYVVNSFNEGWIYNWERDKFVGRLNADLWVELLELVKKHHCTFKWVKGHAGDYYNTRCDKLAVEAIDGGILIEDVKKDIHDNGMKQLNLF